MPDLGLDHFGVLFKENLNLEFKDFPIKDPNIKYSNQELDNLTELFTSKIVNIANSSIPKSKILLNAKPWWNEELKILRKSMLRFSRKFKASGYLSSIIKKELLNAKNLYFNTIKIEKLKHWNLFLEKEDTQSIYKAMSYTKEYTSQTIPSLFNSQTNTFKLTFQEKSDTFRNTLFPPPPISSPINLNSYIANKEWKWPKLSYIELENSCTSKIKGKTPGPDLITQEIIVQAYLAIPNTFFNIYSILIDQGYYPKVWKQATGFILKKPKKPDYSLPKAYRVIALLNCLGKVSERILARHLSYLAKTTNLLHISQIGSRLYKSAIDTTLLLKNEVEVNKTNKLKTTTLFLDIKGAFDHISKNRLIEVLVNLKLPISLIKWVLSFMNDRILRLVFEGNIESFKPINTGIPQGSPISPILFLIYIRDLFKANSIKFLSYMDDISLIASSKSFKQNIKILERETKVLFNLGTKYAIKFDIDKTELIHFNSGKKQLHLELPNGNIVLPIKLVKWLGIHFDYNLKFKEYIAIRTSLAKQALYCINRLVNILRGLSPFAIRQLYLACITSVADYGSEL